MPARLLRATPLLRRREARLGLSKSTSIPAPVGGWNARDSIADMAPEDAVTLENWFPSTSWVQTRLGYEMWATGFPSAVQTIMVYNAGSTTSMFGVASGNIYDATAGGAIGAAVATGLSNSKFQYINITTSAGTFLMAVNGADKLRYYDGASWTADGATYTITGIDTTTISQINLFKNRVWLIPTNTLKAWYLPTSSIQGAAASLDLSAVASRGGYLMAMATWTIDAGYGIDDLAAFITSEGEVIVYRGTDPTSATTWALVGVWWLGSPIGRRCYVKFGGDALLITEAGVYPLSAALQSDRVSQKLAITDKIQSAMSEAVTVYGANFGWQLLPFEQGNMLIMNVPVAVGIQEQFVMNTITKQWCNFTGWPANCWELVGNEPYFGGATSIARAWSTYADAGQNIECYGLQAFNYYGSPGKQKRFTLMRPVFQSTGSPDVQANMNTDFDTNDTAADVSFTAPGYALWDVAEWDDLTSLWGGSLTVFRQWLGTTGVGYCGAPLVKAASNEISVLWVATDVVYEEGAIL